MIVEAKLAKMSNMFQGKMKDKMEKNVKREMRNNSVLNM